MTVKRYIAFAVITWLLVLGWLTIGLRLTAFTALCLMGVALFFSPSIVAMNRRLKRRFWIVLFNFFCFPISLAMVLLDQPDKL